MTNFYTWVESVSNLVEVTVQSGDDLPKLRGALEEFGWFESAERLTEKWNSIVTKCLGEYNVTADNFTTTAE